MSQAIYRPGRVALVSDGSRGIGAATVRRLAADGWDVGFSYHGDGPSAREVEKDACELGGYAIGTDVDVTDAGEVSSWFRLAEEELGPVQAMVSCAGITREQPLARLAEADWRAVIDTSLDGVFHLCRTAVFAMMARRSGRIVTVSSVCGADLAETIELRRFGTAAEVADLVASLLSADAPDVTGRVLEVPTVIAP